MNQRVGTCSICEGDVMGFRGAWFSVLPPPPDECGSCGAIAASDVIPMVPRRRPGIDDARWAQFAQNQMESAKKCYG